VVLRQARDEEEEGKAKEKGRGTGREDFKEEMHWRLGC